jgi:molybdopterin biosynthesis enzyme
VFTCFYVYVHAAIRRMSGYRNPMLREETLELGASVASDGVRWRLLKARADRDTVVALPHQGSHMVSSLVETDSLIVVPPGQGTIEKGTPVKTYLLPLPEVSQA